MPKNGWPVITRGADIPINGKSGPKRAVDSLTAKPIGKGKVAIAIAANLRIGLIITGNGRPTIANSTEARVLPGIIIGAGTENDGRRIEATASMICGGQAGRGAFEEVFRLKSE